MLERVFARVVRSIGDLYHSIGKLWRQIPNKREILGLLVGAGLIAFAPQLATYVAPWGTRAIVAALIKFFGLGVCATELLGMFVLDVIEGRPSQQCLAESSPVVVWEFAQ